MSSTRKYIESFALKLSGVIPIRISTHNYCAKYLGHLIDHKEYYLQIYSAVLDHILGASEKKREEICLVDFGAGNGLLGMFAKHCGFKKVYLNDIDKSFVEGSEALANELQIEIAGFIHGDIIALKNIIPGEIPDVIAGTDVIEHIYDLDIFFSTLHSINPGIVSVFTTASNPENYFKVRKLKQLQQKDELEGGDPGDFLLFGQQAHESFLQIRKNIINETGLLPESAIDRFARATRGYDKKDLIEAVNKFVLTKELPQPPAHPTNTCNPLNSSWTERILSLEEYNRIYDRHGFALEIYPGFYDRFKRGLKKYLNRLLNLIVKIPGKKIAPFIILVGYQKNKNSK